MKFCLTLLLTVFSLNVFSQSEYKLNPNEGYKPRVSFFIQEGDTWKPLTVLRKGVENKVLVKVEGGIERVPNILTLSSRQAHVAGTDEKGIYLVSPLSDGSCDLTVDIKIFQDFTIVEWVQVKNRQEKRVVQTLTPRTYMIAYEIVEVI